MKKNIAYKTALSAILCALALSLSFLENLIPPIPFLPPGAKPGFSNIITMFAAGSLGLVQTLMIVLVKGCFALVTRGVTAGIMSFSGGLLSAIAMFILLKYGNRIFGLMGISVISALCHNTGQLIAAAFITGTPSVVYYAPALAIFGIVTGAVTGVIFKAVIPALNKLDKTSLYKKDRR